MTSNQELAAQQAAGLRALAELLDEWPDLAQYIRVPLRHLVQHLNSKDDPKRTFGKFIREAKAHGAKIIKDYGSTEFAEVTADFGAVRFGLQTYRDEVCERVVVGTREVTDEVPDPEALAAVPTTTVTRVEEITEWRCRPLLADASTALAGDEVSA